MTGKLTLASQVAEGQAIIAEFNRISDEFNQALTALLQLASDYEANYAKVDDAADRTTEDGRFSASAAAAGALIDAAPAEVQARIDALIVGTGRYTV